MTKSTVSLTTITAVPAKQISDILTPRERDQHAADEALIERGLTTFMEVGQALMRIRDNRTYRETHDTFEDYCRDRWQMSRIHAHRLIEAAEVTENLLPIGNILPATESQVRSLARLEPEQQRTAWETAVATAETMKEAVTAAIVTAAVEVIKKQPEAIDPATQTILETKDDALVQAVIQEYTEQKVKKPQKALPQRQKLSLPDEGPLSQAGEYRGPRSKAEEHALWIWGRMKDFERDGHLAAGAEVIYNHMYSDQKQDVARLIRPILQFFHDLEALL